MRHDDVADASLGRRLDEGEDLVATEVTGAEDEVVAGDDVEHLVRLGEQRPPGVDDRHGVTGEARLAKGELERDPDRHLLVGAAFSTSSCSFTDETVGNHTTRAPSRAATSTARALSPPTERLSVIVPSTVTPGTAAATTCARSAVEL